MPTKLKKVQFTCFTSRSGVDNTQIPLVSSAAAVKVYKQGATVTSSAGPIAAGPTGTVVTVRDIGGIVAGDVVQKGLSSAATATVLSVNSRTSITLGSLVGSLSVVADDRLVPNTNRPTLYTESTGNSGVGSSNVGSDADASVAFYTPTAWVDVFFSVDGGSTVSRATYDVEAGYSSKVIDIRDYGGDLQAAFDALPTSGGGVYLPDGYVCTVSAVVTMSTVNVRLFSDSWGTATIYAGGANPAYHLLNIQNHGFVAENIRFDHRGSSAGNYDIMRVNGQGPVAHGVQPFTVRNCYFLNARRNGIRITGGVFQAKIVDCSFGGYGNGVFGQSSAYSTANSNDPPTISSDDTPTHIEITGCEFSGLATGATQAAAEFHQCTAVTIHRCQFESIAGGYDSSSANAIHCDTVAYARIEKCHFEMATSGTYAPGTRVEQLVVIAASSGAHVSDCSVFGTSTTAVQPKRWVRLQTSGRCVFVNNRVSNLHSSIRVAIDADSNSIWTHVIGGIYETGETDTLYQPSLVMRAEKGLGLPVYADDTARGLYADTTDGTMIVVAAPTTPNVHLQFRIGGAWVGIAKWTGAAAAAT